jgi:hypothetical protein
VAFRIERLHFRAAVSPTARDYFKDAYSRRKAEALAEALLPRRSANDVFAHEFQWHATQIDGRAKIERDTRLGEALAYCCVGSWGKNFYDAVANGLAGGGESVRQFEQLAYDGKLHAWGKRSPNSELHEEIPREHWKTNQVEWFDLLRGNPRTEPRGHEDGTTPFFDLMVSRAEIEQEMPYEG